MATLFILVLIVIVICIYYKKRKQLYQTHNEKNVVENNKTESISVNDFASTDKLFENKSNASNNLDYSTKSTIGLESAMEYYKNSPNPKFHRTESENELCFQFYSKNIHTVEEYEERIYNNSLRTKNATIDEQLKMDSSAIKAYNEFKKYCYKTKGGTIYFQDMYEHCHNSNNPDFNYIDRINDNYTFLTKHYDTLINLDSIIIQTINSNPGLLQKDIYKLINVELKSIIQHKIRELETENKIKRTKQSGSYLLELQDNELTIINYRKPINNNLPTIDITETTNFDEMHTTELTAGLKIPDEVINLLWIKGGPLENYTSEMNEANLSYGISFSTTKVTEPSLIDLSLVLDTDICGSDFLEDIGYYPSYEKLTPKQRYVYLNWLQDVSKPVAMGYVFIFYYGLERHLMFGKYREAIKMISYLQQFHKNNSFYAYSTDAMLISILKHNDLSLLKSINIDNASNNIYALVKGALSKGYSAEDITKLYKVFGFTNNRYIKNQYVDFVNSVRDILVERFSSDYYPLPTNTIDNCSKQQLLIVANYSLMHQDRFASAPDIASNRDVYEDIHNILVTAHETVKTNNRKKK